MKVLEHMLVFEICQGVAGPTAGVTLADLGAQVIKIEPPTGDYGRQLPFQDVTVDGESLFFQVRNRNKQAVAVDFDDPEALGQLQQWLSVADVVTTNYPTAFMQQYGLDYQTLTTANPQLIYATVDGLEYAWTSPTLCQDELLCQALSGLCYIQGDHADTPLPIGTHIGGLFAGVYLTQGILATLYHRRHCKKGMSVQTSTLQALIDIQCESITTALYAADFMPQRATQGNAYAVLCAPYGTYKTKDDYIALGIIDIPCLFASMGLDLPQEWAHPQQWLTKREDIRTCIQAKLATETTAYWLARFEAADFWCAAVHDIQAITKHPGYELVRMAQTIQTNHGEAFQTTRCPFRLNGTRLTSTCGAPALQTDRSQIDALLEQRKEEREKRTKLGTTHNRKNSLLTKCIDRRDKAFETNTCHPLKGLVVVDLTQFLSGPTASLRLADLGAEVIKIERPKVGDAGRQIFFNNITMDNTSSCFMATARGKRSCACDLKDRQDRILLNKLIKKADIVLQNFRPEAARRLELDYAHICAINPQIIYGEITGYGHEGPWVSKPGQDLVMQALSGLTSLQQAYHNAPMAMGLPVVDLYTGSRLVEGLLAAVLHKEMTGEGGQVSLSMLEAAIDLEAEAIAAFQYNQNQSLAWRTPAGIYATRDGYIALGSDAVRYIDMLASIMKKETGIPSLQQGFAQKDTANWLDILQAQDIPCVSVLTWHQLIDSPISTDLELFQTVRCRNGYKYQTTTCPIRFNGDCSCVEHGAPDVGEHSRDVEKKYTLLEIK